MLQKIIDRESLKNFPKNVYDGVCFSKIASLCCTNCNSTITSILHRFFSEYVKKKLYSGFHYRGFPAWFLPDSSFDISAKFLRDICHSLSNKVAGLQSIGCNFTEKKVFD